MKLILVIALAGIAGALSAAAPAGEEASAIGQKWLSLLDDQKYEESWTQAGSMFRNEVKHDQWLASLQKFRLPLGPLISRTASRVDLAKTLPAAPDGEYAIIHYKTVLQSKTITERLTLAMEDGKWQVYAYAIH
ncbi:MAG TPA: DUF4019 domain-containing protein [Bryobacteraceae bacterium]|nr:DUF4019 domain-containing protein [Bryobacteraceae bacterium]